jgi:EpsI family protein
LPVSSIAVLILAFGFTQTLTNRTEIVPDRANFIGFPKQLGEWRGQVSLLSPQIEHGLGLEDYLLTDFKRADGNQVNFYVAYYASQRTGTSPHSPIVCIPGGGWRITRFDRTRYENAQENISFPFNRVVIQRDSVKQLVYYWFEQRGRKIANEYLSKWYLLTDAITRNRTDGALIRLTTPIYPGEEEEAADQRLRTFIRDATPRLKEYLPPETLPLARTAQDATRSIH